MKKILVILVCMVIGFTAMAKGENDSIVSFTITPTMHCINCENKIKGNLRFEKGVKDIKAAAPDSIVTITFDKRKTNVDNIVKGFSKLGYTAAPASSTSCNSHSEGCCEKPEGCCKKPEGCCEKPEGCCKKTEGCCKKVDR